MRSILLLLFALFVIVPISPSLANTCVFGDVPDELVPNYLPPSQLQTSVREWAAISGYLAVSSKTIEVSFVFEKTAINTFKSRTDFAFEIDVVDFGNIITGGWEFTAEFGDALVVKDISISDNYHQLSLMVLNPHLLEENREYKVRFDLSQPIQNIGKLKLNTDLSVSFRGSTIPPCYNPFFHLDDWTYGGNYFKLETEEYSAFWYTPNTSLIGVCWTNKESSGLGPCSNSHGAELLDGNLTLVVDGSGHVGLPGVGIQSLATDQEVQLPPDFVVKRTWLTTPWGDEIYKFGLNESFDTKAQSENIGDGQCVSGEISTITGHFYLSRGYKEDVHSGDGAWRRIDSTTTQCDNLKPGDTHTETKNTVISQWITTPGIYNIVYCIDHPQDDHNNGGDHQEKHESNNCSTEAVFEITANPVENQDPRFVDFVTSGLQFQQAPYYAGDQARFGATVTNQGNIGSPADIRSSYSVQCPGTGLVYLADDGTMASTLSAGASAFEENIGPVTLPNVAGTCTAYFCADYQGAVTESDEGNNCTSLSFILQPRPAPKLVITKFQDEVGCCTTNRGSRIKPDIWVRNDGPVAPASDVTVLYHISSPVATGGAWWNIGYGVIRPSELPPGGTDEDYMEGNGWPIPSGSAWKLQWHTVRACLKQDGSTPVGDPNTEVCAYYTRYSKK